MKKTTNLPRKAIQWTVLGLMILFAIISKVSSRFIVDYEAYCPFGGLQALGSFLLNNALSCTMTGVQIVMGIALIVVIILLSKLFCSFICPLGTISEWMSQWSEKLRLQLTIPSLVDKGLRSIKYALLFTTLYYTLQSNELFCKKFDPFYGVSSGFDSDVVLFYSIASIVALIVGSIFIRLFWCKYLCPLGAISNIFKFSSFFAVIIIVYVILLKVGINISYVWPLAIACIGGYIIEITQLHGKVFPLVKVTRNTASCTNCNLCSKKCHQGIDVANMKVIKDADCNLCGDCVSACPVKNTLQFNQKKKLRYLPHIGIVVMVLVGMAVGQLWEIPTINQKWADFDDFENVKTYTRSGLSSVKCYGSCASFANKMRRIDGVLGVTTFVDNQTAEVHYDASRINEETIDRAIFTPQKVMLRELTANDTSIIKVHVTLENFFDRNDFSYLARFLQENTNAVALTSEFGCPVIVDIYFSSQKSIDTEKLTKLLETKSFKYKSNEKEYTATMGYKVKSGPKLSTLDIFAYANVMFVPVNLQFNKSEQYSADVKATFSLKSTLTNANRNKVKHLVSHLSNDDGIVEFRTVLNENHKEEINITYVDTLTTPETIKTLLQSDSLQINYRDGSVSQTPNPFNFEIE